MDLFLERMVSSACSASSYKPRLKAHRDPTKTEWERLTAPAPGQAKPIVPGSKSERETFQNMEQVRAATDNLTYHPLDAFVASVASGIDAGSVSEPDDTNKEEVLVAIDKFYSTPVTAELGKQHGPGAPMMVILPGIYGSNEGGFQAAFKKIAYERGMNYTVLRNPLNEDSVDSGAKFHPGNIELEAEATHAILKQLRQQKPAFFQEVSLTGYSYGAILSANVAKFDEANETEKDRIVQGGVVAISPPQNLEHSMRELDGLRERYAEGAGSVIAAARHYSSDVSRLGYANFMESELAARGEGENITEIKIADSYGSRDEMKDMVAQVDSHFEHNQLPPVWPDYFKRRKVLNQMTYAQYSDEWFSKDPWLVEQGVSVGELAERNSYEEALDALEDTPVLTILSQDDYILNAEDVETFRELEAGSNGLEYTRVMDHGGHVGILFNPEVQNIIGDFAYSGATLNSSH